VRNSDPDAALYWLGRMIEAAKDPPTLRGAWCVWQWKTSASPIPTRFPSAWPRAMLSILLECLRAILLSRKRSSISQSRPKSNALYTAYSTVQHDIEQTAAEPVPLHFA